MRAQPAIRRVEESKRNLVHLTGSLKPALREWTWPGSLPSHFAEMKMMRVRVVGDC